MPQPGTSLTRDPQQANGLITGDPTPSPDGQLIAFIATDSNNRSCGCGARSIEARQLPVPDGALRHGHLVARRPMDWLLCGRKVERRSAPPAVRLRTIGPISGFQDAAQGASGEIIFRPVNRAAISGLKQAERQGRLRSLMPPVVKTRTASPVSARRTAGSCSPPLRRPGEQRAVNHGSIDSPEVTRIMAAQSRVAMSPGVSGSTGALLFTRMAL